MNTFKTFGQNRAYSKQQRSLSGPIARRSRAVLFAGNYNQRYAFLFVLHGGIVDEHLLSIGHMPRPAAFHAGNHLISEPDIAERAAHHYFVIASPRAIAVEIGRFDAKLD